MQSALFFPPFQLALVIIAFLALHPVEADAEMQPVNSVLGDRSFVQRFGVLPDNNTDEDLRIRTHLEYVEHLLRSRDVSHLPAPIRAERIRNIERLRDYLTQGIFPRNYDHPGRRPCFIDRDGRICAVGYLVEQSAGRAVAEELNREFKYARIVEMKSNILERWLAASGLTLEEAAMIQPEYNFQRWYSFYHLEPSQMTLLGLRGGVRRVVTTAPDSVSIATFNKSAGIHDLHEMIVVPVSSNGRRDTVRRTWQYGPEHHDITWTKSETYINGVLTAWQKSDFAYRYLMEDNRRILQYGSRDSWEKFVEYHSLRDGAVRTDSVHYFDIDTLDRLIKLRSIRYFPSTDTTVFSYTHDTLAETSIPAGWGAAGVPVAFIFDSLRRSGREITRMMQYRERGNSAWEVQRPDYEEIKTWAGWTLTMHRNAKNGTYQGSAVQRDIWGLVLRELHCSFASYEAYLAGKAKFLGETLYEYTFDKKWHWIIRERKKRKRLGDMAVTDEVVKRSIEYF